MEFRIGINLGDVVEEEGRIYGDGVNIAARLEALAEAGGICISGTAYDQVVNKMGLEYEFLGEQKVKNIERPIRVYRVLSFPGAAAHRVIKAKSLTERKWLKVAITSTLVLVLGVVILAIWNFYFRPPPMEVASVEKMAFPLPDKPSIAVLAFDNMSGDPKQDYLCDGIAEDIITQISQFYNMFVIARNSSFSYKGKKVKVRQVAEELGVRYVLEGSVQKSGDRVRITAQLVDAITGKHLWAHRYDRELKDIFAIQDEITRQVVAELAVKLVGGEIERIRLDTQNLEAWTCFRKAIEKFRRFNMEGFLQARELSKKAIEMDPDFPGGYYMLCWTYALTVKLGWSKSPREDLKRAEEIVNKCLALNDSDPHAYNLLGYIYLGRRQYDKAIQQGQHAVSLAPSMADSHAYLADSLMLAGRAEEAIEEMTKAMRLAPVYPTWYLWTLGQAYYSAGRFEEAIATFEEHLKREPDLNSQLWMAVIYSAWGREEEARAEAEAFLRKRPTYSLERFRKGLLYKDPAIIDRILTFARKAGIPETPPIPLPDKPSIAVLPFTNMSEDPKQEYFSDGITENIISTLSHSPNLFVIARNSTFTYKGKSVDVRQVGRELGARYVLEGSVQKTGERIRITAQLIDAKSGNHLWSERYDRDLKDIFALQDEITLKIMAGLGVELGEIGGSLYKGINNLEVWKKFVQANQYLSRMNKEGSVLAREKAEEVIALDPDIAGAYVLIGTTHILDLWFGASTNPLVSFEKATEAARKALTLDDNNSEAHCVLGFIFLTKREHEKAIAEAKRAIALNPNNADAYNMLGLSLHLSDRSVESIGFLKKAIRLNPFPRSIYLVNLGNAYRATEQYEEAIETYKKSIKREPNNIFAYIGLTATYSLMGREKEAHESALEVLKIDPEFSLKKFAKTIPFKNQDRVKRVIEALRKAGLK
jgi:adenylate cyclase